MRFTLPTGSLALLLGLPFLGCGSETGAQGAGGQGAGTTVSNGGSGNGGNGGNGGSGGSIFTDHGQVVSLAIDPNPGSITAQNGASASAQFKAIATFEDAYSAAVDAAFVWDQPKLAFIDGTGLLTAYGNLAGQGVLKATFDGIEATSPVTIQLTYVDNTAGLTPEDQALFDTPNGSPSGTLLYPYDQTVFARGLVEPEIMWAGGAPGDVYRVRITEPLMEGTFYIQADPPSDFKMPQAFWTNLTQSNSGGDVSVEIQRLSGGQAYSKMSSTWKIAQGSLRGSIYYWAVNTGQLMKIAPGAESPNVVFDSGPADALGTPAPSNYDGTVPPWESGGENKRCVACHTVSKDGSRIASVFERKGSTASPWGSIDLTQNPPVVTQVTPYDSNTIFLGISPDGAYAVANDSNMTMHLADAKTGATLASALDGFVDNTADPAFAPNGKLLAFSSFVDGFYPVEFYRADLDVIDFDPMNVSFSNRRTVVSGGTLAIAFPSFSPDSDHILYQYGDYSRAKYGAGNDISGNDDLFMTDVAGSLGHIPLGLASGNNLETRNQHKSYQPTVNPISVGGYTWVVFVSPRDYGNKMLSQNDPTVENRKQLWVAAIDQNPTPGKDPSHPAFWLPGQALGTINMSGYWALEPCHQEGTSCNEGYECCTGFCQPDGMGGFACEPPPAGCSGIGNACKTNADCCDSPNAKCIGGFCAQSEPN